jgi:hypothetical protein
MDRSVIYKFIGFQSLHIPFAFWHLVSFNSILHYYNKRTIAPLKVISKFIISTIIVDRLDAPRQTSARFTNVYM